MCLKLCNQKGKVPENSQGIIQDFLKDIFLHETKRMDRKMNLNDILSKIVEQTEGELQSIIIFNLKDGLPLYYNKQLKQTNPALYTTLFGDGDIGQALEKFKDLRLLQNALNSFGEATNSGELNYSIFKLQQAQLMVYFHKASNIPVAICFLSLTDILLGRLVSLGRKNIDEIKNNIPDQ